MLVKSGVEVERLLFADFEPFLFARVLVFSFSLGIFLFSLLFFKFTLNLSFSLSASLCILLASVVLIADKTSSSVRVIALLLRPGLLFLLVRVVGSGVWKT